MGNGVIFGTKNSVTDWDLLMTSKQIGKPEARTNYIEIPGRDGTLDLTEALGEIKYNDKSLNSYIASFNFEIFCSLPQIVEKYILFSLKYVKISSSCERKLLYFKFFTFVSRDIW